VIVDDWPETANDYFRYCFLGAQEIELTFFAISGRATTNHSCSMEQALTNGGDLLADRVNWIFIAFESDGRRGL